MKIILLADIMDTLPLRPLPFIRNLAAAFLCVIASSSVNAQAVPDLNLGPTGMHGWMYHPNTGPDKYDSADSRQILVNSVDLGSPADGVLAAGDVILGVSGDGTTPVNFTSDARKTLAYAIADAEARNVVDNLKLLRWRAGVTTEVSITLPFMDAYSLTAPYNCPKSTAILEQGLDYVMSTTADGGKFSFDTLALLAVNGLAYDNGAGNNDAARQARAQAEVLTLLPDATELALMNSDVVETTTKIGWRRGHQLIVLAEYYLQTVADGSPDTSVLPAIEAHAKTIAKGQSMFGTIGHQFALQLNPGDFNGPYYVGLLPWACAGKGMRCDHSGTGSRDRACEHLFRLFCRAWGDYLW